MLTMSNHDDCRSIVFATISIVLWASLAALILNLSHMPPFLLVSLSLGIGSLLSLKHVKTWFQRWDVVVLGTTGIFGYHLLLFVALRKAPAIEANLINYTWPILIILLSPLILPRNRLLAKHLIGGAMAFAGAGFAIGGTQARFQSEFIFGYSLALGAALIWALYSLLTKRLRPFPSAAVGGFCFASAILALICHFILEPTTNISVKDWGLILIIGVGPLGMAFYTWDAAIKLGDPKKIAALSYITPLLSTLILAASSQENSLTFSHLLAVLLIIAGAMLSQFSRAKI